MTFAKTKFGKIYYEIKGQGETIVLIRGLGRWSEHWNGFDRRLAENCRVITFDSKSLGKSTERLLPWHTVTDLAADVALILKTEGIESAHIAGVSLGGMMALEFAASFPEMTKSATAINASIGRSGHQRMTWQAGQLLVMAPSLKDKIYPDLARLLLAKSASPELIDELANNWLEVDRKYPRPFAAVAQQLVAALRWRDVSTLAKKIKCPVQIIVSDEDQFVPRGNSLFLAKRIPGAVLTRLASSGHEPHVDQPEALEKALITFLK